jgi:hypothetical protein
MNLHSDIPTALQYSFYLNSINPCKRYVKWPKKGSIENLDLIREWYGFSIQKAKAALAVLSDEQIDDIKTRKKDSEDGSVGKFSRS